jgi:uracil-DNA glycosylase family 4
MKPHGKGARKILFIAEAPGKEEDERGLELVGESGQLLRETLKHICNIKFNRDCWRTNSVVCRPPKNKTPSKAQIEACRPNVIRAIKKFKPVVIILLGGPATESVLGTFYTKIGTRWEIGSWSSWQIPLQEINAWVCPTYHPAALTYEHSKALNRLWVRDLRRATSITERPWTQVPDYKSEIEVIGNPRLAAKLLREWLRKCTPRTHMTFDYETTSLKPEWDISEIVTASVCWDHDRTISFPFSGNVIDPFSELLKSPAKKIGQNIKFEERWTRRILGHGVRHWYWDTMNTSHILDHRKRITGLKFQSFVQFGLSPYDDHIEPFLKETKHKHGNNILEIDMADLLLYGGMDSLMTDKLAIKQMKAIRRLEKCRNKKIKSLMKK